MFEHIPYPPIPTPPLGIPPSLYADWIMPHKSLGISTEAIDAAAAEGRFPSFDIVVPAILCAIVLGMIRKVLQPHVFRPLAIISMDLKVAEQKKNAEIEEGINFKLKDKKERISNIQAFCVSKGYKPIDVVQYVSLRMRNRAAEVKITKFCEALWRFVFYALYCVIGYFVLFHDGPAPWVLDTRELWTDWFEFKMTKGMLFYYHVELGCYMHQLVWTEVSRSDAVEMILHHVITIFLLLFSLLAGFTRIGTSILLCHDIADIFLEMGKCINYVGQNNKKATWAIRLCDGFFVCFVLSFAYTRLYIFPFQLIRSVWADSIEIYGSTWNPAWTIFTGLLCGLQCLHIFWFALILRMVVRLFAAGKVSKDVRSDDEFDGEEEEDEGEEDIVLESDKAAALAAGVSKAKGPSTITQRKSNK